MRRTSPEYRQYEQNKMLRKLEKITSEAKDQYNTKRERDVAMRRKRSSHRSDLWTHEEETLLLDNMTKPSEWFIGKLNRTLIAIRYHRSKIKHRLGLLPRKKKDRDAGRNGRVK
jgi:hypothetical protein